MRWTSRSSNIPSRFMLRKPEISACLMGHLARMQTLPSYLLTLFRPDCGGEVGLFPRRIWALITFFNIEANATKVGDFFQKFIWQRFDMTGHYPRDFTFPWQPYFERHVFQTFNFSHYKKLKQSFLVAF